MCRCVCVMTSVHRFVVAPTFLEARPHWHHVMATSMDASIVSRAYEKQIQNPVRNAVAGDLVQLMLIQVRVAASSGCCVWQLSTLTRVGDGACHTPFLRSSSSSVSSW